MKIVKLVVTDENGVEHTYSGEGHVTDPRSNSYKNKPYTQTVTANITLPAKDVKNA